MKSTPSPATTTRTQRKEKKNASKAKKKKGSNSPRSSVPVYIIIGELLFLYRELRTYLKTTTTTITDTATGERKQKHQQHKKKTGKKKTSNCLFLADLPLTYTKQNGGVGKRKRRLDEPPFYFTICEIGTHRQQESGR